MPEVRLIDDDGSQIGVKARDEALEYAWAKNLDLVEVAPDARPPVCRVMDYGKYKYDQEQKQKLARKHQSTITIKEIKLRPKIDPHDYATKRGHVMRFLKARDKVKVTIMFRGREMQHPDRGRALLERLAADVVEIGVIESEPLQDGRNMVMLLGPVKEVVPIKPGSENAAESDADQARVVAPAPAAETVAPQVSAPATLPVEAAESVVAESAPVVQSKPVPVAKPKAPAPKKPAAAKLVSDMQPEPTAKAPVAKKPAAATKTVATPAKPATKPKAAAAPKPPATTKPEAAVKKAPVAKKPAASKASEKKK